MKIVNNNQIDKKAWTNAIRRSTKPLINAEAWFLDIVSPNWCAIVNNDYSVVAPLPVKNKFGLKYMLQPYFTQQLGIFCHPKSKSNNNEIVKIIKKLNWHLNINLHEKSGIENAFFATKRNNQIIKLTMPYTELVKKYSASNNKNLRRASKNNLEIRPVKLENAIDFFEKEYPGVIPSVNLSIFNIYKALFNSAQKNAETNCYGVFSGQTLTSVMCLIHNTKHINTLYLASPLGKNLKALFLLIDYALMQYALSNMVFDFGGSDIDGIAYFNKGFGAITETYFQVKWNKILSDFFMQKIKS